MGPFSIMIQLAAVCATVVAAVSDFPRPQGPEGPLPIPREGSYGPDQYFQYINVPAHNTFEAKLKWNDGYAGHGEHYFDYNHGDNGYKAPVHHAPAYSPPKPAYAGSETDERIVEAPSAFA